MPNQNWHLGLDNERVVDVNSRQVQHVRWRGRTAEQRRQRVERGETTFSSLEDVKTRLRNLVK